MKSGNLRIKKGRKVMETKERERERERERSEVRGWVVGIQFRGEGKGDDG